MREIVVLGGSAGSVEALQKVVGGFPADLAAAVFIVVHMRARNYSSLAEIFSRCGPLSAQDAGEGDPIEPGHIYVVVPDRHLIIGRDHMHLSRGPKEGLHRPSINLTFRSAASSYGSSVVGVLLSGMMDDGASGLWEIARHGGVTVVQDPDDAQFPSMPMSALQDADIDYILKAAEIGKVVGRLAHGDLDPPKRSGAETAEGAAEFSGFTCPECRGPLYREKRPGPVEFHCRVGHVISLGTLVEESASTRERKLYEAMVALDEGADLSKFAASRVTGAEKEDLLAQAKRLQEYSSKVRQMVEGQDGAL